MYHINARPLGNGTRIQRRLVLLREVPQDGRGLAEVEPVALVGHPGDLTVRIHCYERLSLLFTRQLDHFQLRAADRRAHDGTAERV